MATSLPTVSSQSTGAAQTAVPFTFGQVFAPGHLLPTDGLLAGAVQLQVDVKATHADGSVRHAVLSGVMPRLGAGETVKLQLAKTLLPKPVASAAPADLTAAVEILLGGVAYTATLVESDWQLAWLEGQIVSEASFTAPLRTAAGDKHSHLAVRFGVRWYPGAKRARVEFVVENTKTFTGASLFKYDAALLLNGQVVYERKALTHYHHARWRVTTWTGGEPALVVHPDTAYLIASKAVPNYDQTIKMGDSALNGLSAQITEQNTGPMLIGPYLARDMGSSGGRAEIGPLPMWSVAYLLTADKRARAAMLATAEGSAAWSIHYRDEKTGYPVRADSEENKRLSTHPNLNHAGPLPVPRAMGDDWSLTATPYAPDTAHQPSLAYLPYLVTGEYYYLEELHFWASTNPLGTDPGYSGMGAGLLRWQQLRGQAWSMRTLGHAAYITPDKHPLKAYFVKQLDNNIEYYTETFVRKNPNKLGVYDGSGEGAFGVIASANWQDDFFTWSLGHLVELGFEKARPVFEWKAKFPVGRMTGAGYCWIHGAPYYLNFRDNMQSPLYETFAELYAKNFYDGNMKDDNGNVVSHPKGLKWADQPCGSQAQADWLTAATGTGWLKGQMWGYSASATGYPADMQPALAVSADSGIPNAPKAWTTFDGRTAKPDYGQSPQFAIVPRTVASVAYVPHPEPAPAHSDAPVAADAIKVGTGPTGAGNWVKVGSENQRIRVEPGSFVRYGAEGKGYVIAQVKSEFDATNAAFGKDPALNVIKTVELFVPAAAGKITTPSSTKLAKLKGLAVEVFNPDTLTQVKEYAAVTASSKGVLVLPEVPLAEGVKYAATVKNANGEVLVVMYPLTAV